MRAAWAVTDAAIVGSPEFDGGYQSDDAEKLGR
jgi:hypothetical protein